MSHEISIATSGQIEAVFGYGEIPWWNSKDMSATVLDGAVGFDDIFSIAFPWTAEMEQLQYADGSLSAQHGIRRSDTLVELGVHSGGYGNIQPRKLFDFCAAFFQAYPEIPIASAIAMQGGAVLNISARIGEINILNSGDIHKSYLCFVNSFNGRIKAQVYKSYVRPVCMNTTKSGLASADFSMEYKHTKNVEKRIEKDIGKAQQLMLCSQATDDKVKEVLETLAKRKLVGKDGAERCDKILTELFGEGNNTRGKNIRADVLALFADNDGNQFPDWKNTPYSLYQAVTNYVDHQRGTRDTTGIGENASRFEASQIGAGALLKEKALDVILTMTDGTEIAAKEYFSVPGNIETVAGTSLLDAVISQSI